MQYTIFARWNDGSYRQGQPCYFPPFTDEPQSLQDRIDYVRNFFGPDSFLPVAWSNKGWKFGKLEEGIAASLAAGRLIEKTASGWVALGAEKQEEERSLAEAAQDITVTYDEFLALSMTPTLDKLERELRKGEPTSADLNAAMILRDGPAKLKPVIFGIDYAAGCAPSTAKPAICGLTRLAAQSHRLGSAWVD